MATVIEDVRGLIAAAHELLVTADAKLDALSAGRDLPAPEAAAETEPGACEHPRAKREDVSGFGERAGSRFRCSVCGVEVKVAA